MRLVICTLNLLYVMKREDPADQLIGLTLAIASDSFPCQGSEDQWGKLDFGLTSTCSHDMCNLHRPDRATADF